MTKRNGKRENGQGSIYRRKRGDWVAAVTLPGGQRWTRSAQTETAALAALKELQIKVAQQVSPADERMPVAVYLPMWLSRRHDLAETSRVNYERCIARIVEVLGTVPIGKLAVSHIRQLHAAMEQRTPPYASATINLTHGVLSMGLNDAVRSGVLTRNVAALVSPPAAVNREMRPLNAEEAHRFLAACQGHRFEALFVLAVTTGMRLGELLGIRWQMVDFEAGTLRVMGSVKREHGKLIVGDPKRPWNRRLIPLTALAIAALKARKKAQAGERMTAHERQREWKDDDLVFTTASGRPVPRDFIEGSQLRGILKQARLAKLVTGADGKPVMVPDPTTKSGKLKPIWEYAITPHELRHTAATLLLLDGVNAKVVSDLLGHKSVTITLDRYSHVIAGMRDVAADAMNKRFSGSIADKVAITDDETG